MTHRKANLNTSGIDDRRGAVRMNPLSALNNPTPTLIILLGGVVMLVINILYSAVRAARGNVKAGWFSVLVTLLACGVIVFGTVQGAMAISAPARTGRGGNPAFATGSRSGSPSNGTPALGGAPVTPSNTGNASTTPTPTQVDQAGLLMTAIGGGITLFLALMLYFYERGRSGFTVSHSRGLLNMGASGLVIITALVIPVIPAQAVSAAAAANNAAAVSRVAIRQPSATPSPTPQATQTATLLPSFTAAPSETPAVLPTQVYYTSTDTVAMQASICTATANTLMNLRPDPSDQQPAIGRVIGGALLNITGRSTDGKWVQVIATDTGNRIQGWVSASYVTDSPSCSSQTIPVVNPLGPATQSPADVAVTPCTVITNAATNLRPDPSQVHDPLASIPAKTTLTVTGKSDSSWWQVTYGSAKGWVNAIAVTAAATCNAVQIIPVS
jgi:uncharacterized protein YgiM (DUF1202 family)